MGRIWTIAPSEQITSTPRLAPATSSSWSSLLITHLDIFEHDVQFKHDVQFEHDLSRSHVRRFGLPDIEAVTDLDTVHGDGAGGRSGINAGGHRRHQLVIHSDRPPRRPRPRRPAQGFPSRSRRPVRDKYLESPIRTDPAFDAGPAPARRRARRP